MPLLIKNRPRTRIVGFLLQNLTVDAMKKVLKVAFFLLVGLLLVLGIFAVWILNNGDTLKKIAIEELNRNIAQKVVLTPSQLDITILEHFPAITLKASNLKLVAKDTFLTAGNFEVQFNGLKAWHGDYNIEKMRLQHVQLKLSKDKNGEFNFDGVRKKEPEGLNATGKPVKLGLQELFLEDIDLTYKDQLEHQYIELNLQSAKLQGNFSEAQSELKSEGIFTINTWLHEDQVLVKNKSGNWNGIILNSKSDSTWTLPSLHLQLAALKMKMNGKVKNTRNGLNLHLMAESNHPEIGELISLLPTSAKRPIEHYKSKGAIFFKVSMEGLFNNTSIPMVQIDFGFEHLSVAHTQSKITIQNLSLLGHYSNGHHSVLELKNIVGSLGENPFNGYLKVKDLKHPKLDLKLTALINLKEVKDFFNLDTLETLAGNLTLHLNYTGKLPKGKWPKGAKMNGDLKLTNGAIEFKHDHLHYHQVNGEASFDEGDLDLHEMTLALNSNQLKVEGKLHNLMNYLTEPNESLELIGEVEAKNIQFSTLLDTTNTNITKGKNSATELPFIKNMEIHIGLKANHFTYAKMNGNNLTCRFNATPNEILFETIDFKGMGGTIIGKCSLRPIDKKNMELVIESELKKVNIQSLLKEMDNFGQTSITGNNLSGLISAHIGYKGIWNSSYEADLGSIEAEAKVKIENGELVKYEPLMALSKFLDENSLKAIRFATLENTITVKNQNIVIPEMEIKNSALDFKCSGSQTFAGKLDYHIQLRWKDILDKRNKEKRKEEEEFGEISDDGKSRLLFIKIGGSTEKPVISYDKKGLVKKIKNDIRQEKGNLKKLLNDEWGWFKKDSTVIKAKREKAKEASKPSGGTPFKIKWDDADKKDKEKEEE